MDASGYAGPGGVATEGIAPIALDYDEHEHDAEAGHEKAGRDEHGHDHHGAYDPHVW